MSKPIYAEPVQCRVCGADMFFNDICPECKKLETAYQRMVDINKALALEWLKRRIEEINREPYNVFNRNQIQKRK
jgi:hypothetical protein